jgi:hypothetical protein
MGKALWKGPSFSQDEMEACGAVFHHMAYVTEAQVAFKESYYGYKGAVAQWQVLQETAPGHGILLRDHFAWVKDGARVGPCGPQGVVPLAIQSGDGTWAFRTHGLSVYPFPHRSQRWANLRGRIRAVVQHMQKVWQVRTGAGPGLG